MCHILGYPPYLGSGGVLPCGRKHSLGDHGGPLGRKKREQRLQTLNSMIAEEYNALQIPASQRIGLLKKTSIAESTGEYPVLEHIKGRRVMHFVPVVLGKEIQCHQLWDKVAEA